MHKYIVNGYVFILLYISAVFAVDFVTSNILKNGVQLSDGIKYTMGIYVFGFVCMWVRTIASRAKTN